MGSNSYPTSGACPGSHGASVCKSRRDLHALRCIAPDHSFPSTVRRYCKAVAVAALLVFTVQAQAQTVRWEDYRGGQNTPDDTQYIGPPGAPKFNNFPNAGAIAALQAVAANPANAVRTGASADINFRDFGVDPTANSLCDTRGAGAASQACLYQAQGRVAYALVRLPQAGLYAFSAAHDDNVVLDLSPEYANTNYRAANYSIPVASVGAWTGGEEVYDNFGTFSAATANSCVLLRMWWTNQSGQNFNRLRWTRPDGTAEIIPASAFRDPGDPGSATGCDGSLEATPRLSLLKRHTGNFTVGTNGVYTLSLRNNGLVPTSGTITIVDTLPTGLTFVSATGTGWTCGAAGQVVTCTTDTAILPNAIQPSQITLTVAVGAAAAPSVTNSARVSGGGDPTCPASGTTTNRNCIPNDLTRVNAPNLEVGKSGPANAAVGTAYDYTITVTNTGTAATAIAATVTDVVPAGLTINAATGCSIAGQTVTCPIPTGLSNVAPNNTTSFTINVTPQASTAGTTAINTASVSGGGDPGCTAVGDCPSPPVNTVIEPTSAAYSFCRAPGGSAISNATYGIVNGVQIARYEPNAGADAAVPELALPTVGGDVNALMIDPARDRLLFHAGTSSQLWAYDADNGGWYVAATGVTGNFPRGGMTAAGVGYLMAGGTSPAVSRIDPNGTYGYTVTNIGNVTYDIAPTGSNSSGDIAFDANGDAWLLVGRDLYLVDMTTLAATRQARPLIGGAVPTIDFAGVAFADDGSLYLANNAGGGGSAYYRYDFATGALTQSATTAAGGSRDLASCAFPAQAEPDLSVVKTLAQVNGAAYTAGAPVAAGDVLTYAITFGNDGTAVGTLYPGSVIESVPANTTYVATGNTFNQAAGPNWTIGSAVNVPAGGNAVLNFVVQVNDPLPVGATSVANSLTFPVGPPGPPGGLIDCTAVGNDCGEITPLGPTTSVAKSSNPASGTAVSAGDTVTYTLTVTVANTVTTEAITLTDTLGDGLTLSGVLPAGCSASGQVVTCILAAGAAVGSHTFAYSATVDTDATGSVGNVVVPSTPPGGDPDPDCAACETEHPLTSTTAVAKTSNPATGTAVNPGDTLTYTLTVTVANSATAEVLTLADTLGDGLTFGAVTNAGAFTCTGSLTCTLPASTVPGTYAVSYTATVDADATGALRNVVLASNPPGGPDPDPNCITCTTEHNVVAPVITVAKSSNPGSGTEVRAGDTITYTLEVTVVNSATIDTLTLTDTLGVGLTFGAVTNAGAFVCTGSLTCTLPAGTVPGTYPVTYTAAVDANATRIVNNVVVPGGGTGTGGQPPTCATCHTEHLLVAPRVVIAKSATPGEDREVSVGDIIQYTLTATIENSATLADVRLVDTPGSGLAVGTLPSGCTTQGATVVCVLLAGSVPGTYTFVYPATVTPQASEAVENVVIGESVGGGQSPPECTDCDTRHELSDDVQLRIVKAVGARNAKIGDLIRYTLTVENVGVVNVTDATVVDTPPTGFSYVEGSMAVADRDGAFTLEGRHPLRIGSLDIDVGGRATVVYLLRVGAGVRPGMHVNEAVAINGAGSPVSNVATAQVALDADPLLDDSLVFGTVFDDRDGDGWQDRADLGDVRVQGGFASGAYVPGSTTIDYGNGPQPLADASAPLLHGIDAGAISARQSQADPVAAHRVTIRQRLRSIEFTDDFSLTSVQGVTVRMDAAGRNTVERSGEAAKGLTAAEPTVERVVSAVDGGFEVAYVISNAGIDERGIPGVRIASVEGLLIETDQYGRYHLADVQGGDWGRGRNFILKVDPATLPPGTEFTTANPLVRRVTPGLPVRFDFGVRLPVQVLPGGERKLELELGEVIFAPGSAEVREAYLPAIQRMAERVDEYRGGEVTITADGDSEGLAFARAAAVRDALKARVNPEVQARLSAVLRTRADDPHSLIAGVDAGGALLGTVLFDTDSARIRPEFADLLDAVAQRLEALGGSVVAIVGHTDVRGSHAYNTALGLRRATAVQQALAQRLSPEARARVRVKTSSDPTAPVGTERE